MPKITKRLVDNAMPDLRDRFLRDDEVKGFGLKVTRLGTKTYFLEYQMPGGRGAPKGRWSIGKHGSPWTPDQARDEARRLLEMVRRGKDPREARREANADRNQLFQAYAGLFVADYARRKGLRSWRKMEACFNRHAIPYLGSRPLSAITRQDIVGAVERVAQASASAAHYLHAILRKLFNWAVGRGDLAGSPMTGMQPPDVRTSRDRTLGGTELRALWLATETEEFGSAIRLLLLTGQRRSEVLEMRFEEIDMAESIWTIPKERAKNGKAHIVPLSETALRELSASGALEKRRGLVFTTTGDTPISGVSRIKRRLDAAMLQILQKDDAATPLPPWTLHDIRRTVATGLQRLGIRFEVTEAVLNHLSGSRAGVAGVYQRHDWAAEKRAALEAWGRHLQALVKPQGRGGGNIVSLRGA